ncbi:MAG: hypothetical protein GY805_27705 [Chloroflexi bacterium]|nr:hypothetical protein [Chloroflexota bacterium]
MMQQGVQSIGRLSLESALTASDVRQPTLVCRCGGAVPYYYRREAKIITVFGQVTHCVVDRCLECRVLLGLQQVSRSTFFDGFNGRIK